LSDDVTLAGDTEAVTETRMMELTLVGNVDQDPVPKEMEKDSISEKKLAEELTEELGV
jgi:hypothetical protein